MQGSNDLALPVNPSNTGCTREELVAMTYRAVLRREPDPEGYAAHVAALRNGRSPEDILRTAIDSPEFRWKNRMRAGGQGLIPRLPRQPDGRA